MAEETKAQEVIEEIKNADEETLKSTIEKWYESTRMDGIKIGAGYMSSVIYGVIQKHLKKKTGAKASLRDYQRCMDEIKKIIAVQLTEQNDSEKVVEENDTTEETSNDGTAE